MQDDMRSSYRAVRAEPTLIAEICSAFAIMSVLLQQLRPIREKGSLDANGIEDRLASISDAAKIASVN